MIIVSQDKEEIVNFDKVESIWISDDEERFSIEATGDANSTLGYYKTLERAKEVLIKIMQSYINSENYKYVNGLMTTEELNRLQKGLVCEMPED